ncbi:MAG TPA: caspase family protein [Burkholderiales bacterium]|nr:caspase family protein [Burkholderiales bacterium]
MTQFCRAAAAAAVVLCAPAHGETHALIMAIGNYGMAGATPLKGVVHDVGSAQEIARRLGVRDANMTVLRDGQLTYEGMNGAFEKLRERIAPNDDVFIYYSGHGGRQLVADPDERCAESLVTYDGQAFVDTEVEAKLKGLSGKANRLVVLLDACHSGGVTTRSKADGRFSSKYIARSGGESCQRPVNMLKRNIQSRGPGSGAQNYVYIAAARDNEVSLDEAAGGGVATQAWRDCVTGAARDLDGSGAISAEEVQACAQQIIDKKLANVAGFTAHHISITGNSRAVMSFAQPTQAAGTAAAPSAVSPASTLKDILAQRDDRRTVTLTSPTKLKIGRDRFQLQVSSSHPGYLYLLMAGSDGKTFDMLFPNKLDASNEIQAGQVVRLPRAEWEVTAGGPPGVSQVLAIVTDAPRDFAKLDMKPAGPFSVLDVDASPIAAKDIVLVSTSAPAAAAPECVDPLSRRNLSVQKRCSNAYGAALIAVEEIQ